MNIRKYCFNMLGPVYSVTGGIVAMSAGLSALAGAGGSVLADRPADTPADQPAMAALATVGGLMA